MAHLAWVCSKGHREYKCVKDKNEFKKVSAQNAWLHSASQSTTAHNDKNTNQLIQNNCFKFQCHFLEFSVNVYPILTLR